VPAINRLELLAALEAVRPGLSVKEVLDFSNVVSFGGGQVFTFNGEVACKAKVKLSVEGTCPARPLLDLLNKMDEEEVEVVQENGHVLVAGKRRRAGVRVDKEALGKSIEFVSKYVPDPKTWKPLGNEFCEAVQGVLDSAGKDETTVLVCVHVHPKWVEACDGYQMSRFRLPTGFESPVLVRRDAMKPVSELGVTHFSISDSWVHFKNKAGVSVACRRYLEEYKNLSPFLKPGEQKVVLPKNLAEAVERAEVFSSDNADNNLVRVELTPPRPGKKNGRLRVRGTGVSGWFEEDKVCEYSGPPTAFLIAPTILVQLMKREADCTMTEERMVINGGTWKHAVRLTKVAEENKCPSGSGDS
jgi:hypothetical protein